MKRFLLLAIFFILTTTFAVADASFDETINYQFNNAESYIGEIL